MTPNPAGTPQLAAPQHGPRPLPLFLEMLRSETAASPERRARAMAGLRRYQTAPRPAPRPAMPARYREGRAALRDYGGAGRHVVFVPSLINPPAVLDLTPETSLLRWMADRGFRTWLLDWGAPMPTDRDLDVGRHVSERLLPLVASLDAPPILVGYCLGGTMALAAAALAPVAGVATIAAPWRFSAYGGAGRVEMAALWGATKPACAAMGLAPMEIFQAGFWKLDPARTIAKYEAFAAMAADSVAARSFVALEDWANAGAPLTYAAAAEIFVTMLAEDAPGRGRWSVGGVTIDPLVLGCPGIEFVSLTDQIVPADAAIGFSDRRELHAGHVGMVVGRRAREQLWEPLADWLRGISEPHATGRG